MTTPDVEAMLVQQGWAVLDLPDPSPVHAARARLLDALRRRGLSSLDRLEEYHRVVGDDAEHTSRLYELCRFYWEEHLGQAIVAHNLDLFRNLVGPDLHIQSRPYLRAVRPGRPDDAAPLHRDTYYGASAYEISILVPFTAMDDSAALRVIPGSHLEPDSTYPYVQHTSPDVVIGSPRHQLGFPYAPKLLDASLAARTVTVPLQIGQAAIFGLSLVHGGGINEGGGTRFSSDIRIVHSLAPVALDRGVHAQYFVPLCSSGITRVAQQYLQSNLPRAVEDTEIH